jgi:hypothetical protein
MACLTVCTNHTATPRLTDEDRYKPINNKYCSLHISNSIKMSSDCLAEPTTYVWYVSTGNIWSTKRTQMPEKQNHWLRKEQDIQMPSLLHKVTKGQMWLDIEHKKCKQRFCEQTALEAANWPNTMMKIFKCTI